jgi:hypothetical protein
LVVNETAVFQAVSGVTFAIPADRNSQCWVRSIRYTNSTLTNEKASRERT